MSHKGHENSLIEQQERNLAQEKADEDYARGV